MFTAAGQLDAAAQDPAYRGALAELHAAGFAVFLGIAIAFWLRAQSRIATFLYAMTGYMALSVAILKAVTGAGAAELRLSSHPGKLPQALNSQRYELFVRADLLAPVVNAKGASLYLMTVGGQRFEIVDPRHRKRAGEGEG